MCGGEPEPPPVGKFTGLIGAWELCIPGGKRGLSLIAANGTLFSLIVGTGESADPTSYPLSKRTHTVGRALRVLKAVHRNDWRTDHGRTLVVDALILRGMSDRH